MLHGIQLWAITHEELKDFIRNMIKILCATTFTSGHWVNLHPAIWHVPKTPTGIHMELSAPRGVWVD